MKKIVCILNIFFIYLIMLFPLFIFFGSKLSVFNIIWEDLFNNNVLIPVGLLLVLIVITFLMNIIFYYKHNNKYDIDYLIKSNMIVKLIQIPAYLIIFLVEVICLITIFTFVITFILIILSFISLVMTNIYSINCYRKLKEEKIISNDELIIYSILSFVYCVDVIISIIIYKKYISIKRNS